MTRAICLILTVLTLQARVARGESEKAHHGNSDQDSDTLPDSQNDSNDAVEARGSDAFWKKFKGITPQPVKLTKENNNTSVDVRSGPFYLTNKNVSVKGIELLLGVSRDLASRWRASGAASQGYAIVKSGGTYYQAVEFDLQFLPLDDPDGGRRIWSNGGHQVLTDASTGGGGLKLCGGIRQYFFNAKAGALYFSGAALGVAGGLPLSGDLTLTARVSTEYLTSGYSYVYINKFLIGFTSSF